MKNKCLLAILSFALLLNSNSLMAKNKKSAKDIYQIVVYHFKTTDQLDITENYVKNVYLPALHNLGFKQIGVFTPIANDTAIDKRLYIIVTYSNIQQIETTSSQLLDNQFIKSDSSSYSNAAFNKIPYERMESIILTAFVFLSTNLFYYTVIENGMSHSFSFFWFSLLLYIHQMFYGNLNGRG